MINAAQTNLTPQKGGRMMDIWMRVVIGLWLLTGIILGGCYFYATYGMAKDMRGPRILNHICWVLLGIMVVAGGFISLLSGFCAMFGHIFLGEVKKGNRT